MCEQGNSSVSECEGENKSFCVCPSKKFKTLSQRQVHNLCLVNRSKHNMNDIKEIKEEPSGLEGTSNEASSELEVFQVQHIYLQEKIIFGMQCKKDIDEGVKIEIKEEPVCENGTLTDMKCWTDPIVQDDVKDTGSCITGMDEDFTSTESPRSLADTAHHDSTKSSSSFTNSISENEHSVQINKVKFDGIHEVNERSCGENSSTENLAVKTSSVVYKRAKLCKCPNCGKSYKYPSSLKRHQLTHSGIKPQAHSDLKPHRCEVCEMSFGRRADVKRHKWVHSSSKPYRCDICEKSYSGNSVLQTHKLIHSDSRPYKCEMCEKSFKYGSDLNRHKWIHSGSKPYKCDICGKSFIVKSALDIHKLVHSDSRPYKCDMCEKSYNYRSGLAIHKLTHSGAHPYKCNYCEKTFVYRSVLKRHKYIHSGTKPCKCDTCDKSFNCTSDLKTHKLKHLGLNPYKCNSCEKSFHSVPELNSHQLIHTDSKPYKCNTCEKNFKHRSNLNRHVWIHSGSKPHKCDTCDKSFVRMSFLKTHKLVHADSKP